MLKEISNYEKILNDIPEILEKSNKKIGMIVQETGIKSFYRKLKNKDFYPAEVKMILIATELPEIEKELLELSIQKGLKDVQEGNFINDKDMKYASALD